MTEPAKVVHVTTVHPRLDTRIFRKEATSLSRSGYDVHMVVADGHGDSCVSDVEIHDIGKVSGRLRRMMLQPFRALAKTHSLRPSLVHFHDPELIPVALILRLMGYKVIYDSHEDLPRAILSKHWLAPVTRVTVSWISEHIENFGARNMSAVITATPHIAKRFLKIQPNTVCVTNYPEILDNLSFLNITPEPRTFIYVGAISRKRGIYEMLSAISETGSRLILAGPFEDAALEHELESSPNWSNVEYLGTVDHSRIWSLLSRAQAGLLFFHPEPNHIHSVPNKLFEYMAGGLPILCSNFPDWEEIVIGERIGLSCDPLDPEAIAGLMRQIMSDPDAARDMGRRARDVVMANYRWANEAEKLVALYSRILT